MIGYRQKVLGQKELRGTGICVLKHNYSKICEKFEDSLYWTTIFQSTHLHALCYISDSEKGFIPQVEGKASGGIMYFTNEKFLCYMSLRWNSVSVVQ